MLIFNAPIQAYFLKYLFFFKLSNSFTSIDLTLMFVHFAYSSKHLSGRQQIVLISLRLTTNYFIENETIFLQSQSRKNVFGVMTVSECSHLT